MKAKTIFATITWVIIAFMLVSCTQSFLGSNNDAYTPSKYTILVASNDMEVGMPRIPFIVKDGQSTATEIAQISLAAINITKAPFDVVWEGGATNFSDYTVPYWVFYPEIDVAGKYGVQATLLLEGGETVQHQFVITIQEDAVAPAVGEAGFPSESRIAVDATSISKISSDFQNPDPDFYKLSLAEALNNGRPTIISFSTPAFCTTAFCAPVLETMKEIKREHIDFDYVHIEIFDDFETLTLHQTINEWQLQSEPWTYILNADGIVAARFGGPVSPAELKSHLHSISSPKIDRNE